MKKFLVFFTFVLLFSSCSEYQNALKSDDVAVKYEAAEKMFEAKKYSKAIRLFEQIAPAYKGKPSAEKMFYMYSQSLYLTKQYYSAGYQFESFVADYPKSQKLEEASFLGAKCYSKLSPVYSLDQIDTYKAIDKIQAFIDEYPESTYLAEANIVAKDLREKLEKKAFEVAKQYNTIEDYKSAIVALDNFMINYPGTIYKEKALYYKFDSSYKLAINSVPSKMQERLEDAKTAYNNLVKLNTNSEFKNKADEMLARIENDLKQFSKIN
ncbi:MAG: outer membrane protein assembly factor BamD [Flavobacterium sp.]|uniref:outer membrane protein assembly factor BamD n=1 Tax=Flavobacterium sp. TaxID=239 RepID=UPI0022BB716A|nr:outer membrane protein assembly factor BamD [Flavobacterium sp.]MCZ8331831.1 outer membrane protein assembly factor BamD [Flavobacterium sp.]